MIGGVAANNISVLADFPRHVLRPTDLDSPGVLLQLIVALHQAKYFFSKRVIIAR